ncbi:uncharacterized protein LOC106657476 [Trichogramma pretiosum]|uniref:uncharacterized protein LOC106657476 n=1 Tax=Trichogramma pretiosum TaxID=7493 RepID=UPI0006C97090|nr:uncharacterized protein LOC106657476 [Trichogramma pretiosum]
MKCIFTLTCLLVLTHTIHCEYEDTMFMDEMIKCAKEMGISADQLKEALETKNDEKLSCVNACAMKHLGTLSNGKIQKEKIFELIDKYADKIKDSDKLKEVVTSCADEVSSSGDMPECQLARKFTTCFENHFKV